MTVISLVNVKLFPRELDFAQINYAVLTVDNEVNLRTGITMLTSPS